MQKIDDFDWDYLYAKAEENLQSLSCLWLKNIIAIIWN